MLDDRSYMREPEWQPQGGIDRSKSLTKALIVINVAIWLVCMVLNSYEFLLFRNKYLALTFLGLMDGYLWQFFTHQFLHAINGELRIIHILVNMVVLYFMGKQFEDLYGRDHLFKTYLLCGLGGGILQLFTVLVGHTVDVPMVGASGAISGIIAALLVSLGRQRISMLLFFIIPLRAEARTFFLGILGILTVFAIWPSSATGGGVAHGAHLGGFLAGWCYSRWILLGGFNLREWGPLARLGNKGSRRRKVVQVGTARAYSSNDNPIIDAEEETAQEFMEQEIDPILEKIYKDGIHSLTDRERKILDEARKRMDG